MVIYPSSKVLPYVYMGIHKNSGKIYIGSRVNKNQKLPSHLDLPRYKTSSKIVKPIFEEFDWHIVAEFFSGQDAYDFEQQMIHEQWQVSKEMSLNQVCYHGKKSFNSIGIKRTLSESHKQNMRKPKPPRSEEHCKNLGDALRGKHLTEERKQNMRKPKSEEHIKNMSKSLTGRELSKSHKQNMRKPKSEEHIKNMKASKRVEHSFLTPDGFVIENTTIKELCSQFNLSYQMICKNFRNDKSYKGFMQIK